MWSLELSDPASSIHLYNYKTSFPVFEFSLNEGEFYHAYSFLAGMELAKLELDVSVKGLNQLTAFNKLDLPTPTRPNTDT